MKEELRSPSPIEEEFNLREEVRRVISSPDFHIRIEAGEFKTAVFDFQKMAEHFYQLGKKHAAE